MTASLGLAYHKYGGNNGDDTETAIRLIERALPILMDKAPLEQWVTATMNLSLCYSARIKDDLIANHAKAIQISEQALEKFPREQNPQLWGALQMNLGGLWAEREDGTRTDNLNRAIQRA